MRDQYTGPHQKSIQKYFGAATRFDGKAPVFDFPLTLLCFTNRCGSNMLAEYLRLTTNFTGLHEQLNHDVVPRLARQAGYDSFPNYVAGMASAKVTAAASFGFKASWDQLLMLLRWNIPAMFSGLHILHIQRRDLLAQAVSFSIAAQTKRWNSLMEGEKPVPDYLFSDILDRLNGSSHGNRMIRQICCIYDLPRVEMYYEDLLADPVGVLNAVHSQLGLSLRRFNLGQARLQRQADHYNEAFIARFKQDFIAHISA
ncbi:Stf0 family sulfotransferase [Roseinatronobacter bogoriensis]|uniref:Stf0 family sulfotransferase n=1 Tax=Roseinatronobacter bogoriensis TaxID=119542 RepID=UPI001456299B|nr:Stf0 family sulfotransferase [Rhodobaca barguzinensis]MBB4207089.1 LPS sulfotransferase NodH [Rhodobaca bogoriensis DSM 18756]